MVDVSKGKAAISIKIQNGKIRYKIRGDAPMIAWAVAQIVRLTAEEINLPVADLLMAATELLKEQIEEEEKDGKAGEDDQGEV